MSDMPDPSFICLARTSGTNPMASFFYAMCVTNGVFGFYRGWAEAVEEFDCKIESLSNSRYKISTRHMSQLFFAPAGRSVWVPMWGATKLVHCKMSDYAVEHYDGGFRLTTKKTARSAR